MPYKLFEFVEDQADATPFDERDEEIDLVGTVDLLFEFIYESWFLGRPVKRLLCQMEVSGQGRLCSSELWIRLGLS